MKRWTRTRRDILFESVPFRLRRDQLVSPRTGAEMPCFAMECADWVNVVAITDDRQVVLVRQFRFGRETFSLEVPGGVVEDGEDPRVAGLRELREETGYDGGDVTSLGWVEPNAAIQNNRCHMFLVEGCTLQAEQELDEGEDVEVVLMDLDDLDDAVRSGEIKHALSIAAFHMRGLSGG
jgi:ADP-ribose pyrophosphatase